MSHSLGLREDKSQKLAILFLVFVLPPGLRFSFVDIDRLSIEKDQVKKSSYVAPDKAWSIF
jgi:hypothetical protein